ncbi:hypothetical protein BG004_002879, partial [Podila humilis]
TKLDTVLRLDGVEKEHFLRVAQESQVGFTDMISEVMAVVRAQLFLICSGKLNKSLDLPVPPRQFSLTELVPQSCAFPEKAETDIDVSLYVDALQQLLMDKSGHQASDVANIFSLGHLEHIYSHCNGKDVQGDDGFVEEIFQGSDNDQEDKDHEQGAGGVDLGSTSSTSGKRVGTGPSGSSKKLKPSKHGSAVSTTSTNSKHPQWDLLATQYCPDVDFKCERRAQTANAYL